MLYPNVWQGALPSELKQLIEARGSLQLNVAIDLSLEYLAHLVFPVWIHTPVLKVLDAAGGTGEAVVLQALRYPHTSIAVEEPDAEAREFAKQYVAELGLPQVSFDPAPGETYHVIRSTRPLSQMDDPGAFLRGLGKKLAQPGLITVTADAVFGGPRFEALQTAASVLRTTGSTVAELKTAASEILATLKAPTEAGLWNIPDLVQLTDASGLRIVAFLHPHNYEPERFIDSPAMREVAAELTLVEKAWLTEVLLGQPAKHYMVLVPAETELDMPLITDKAAAGYIPHPSPYAKVEPTGEGRYSFGLNRQHLLLHSALSTEEIEAPAEMLKVYQGINGAATFEQMYRRVMPLSWDVFWHFMTLLAENGVITLHREAKDIGAV